MGHPVEQRAVPDNSARLEIVSGPLKGKIVPLVDGEVSIGREPSNNISLLDSLVSRRHCVIRRDGDSFRLLDLDSRNNTFVGGVPVRERLLAPGDQIRVGNSLLVFQGAGGDSSTANFGLQLDVTPAPSAATVILRKQDALYLQPARPEGLPATPRTVRDLNLLLDFSRSLNSVRGLPALQQQALDAVLSAVPADRAAILLTEDGGQGFTSITGRDRRLGTNQSIRASQTILNRVLNEDVAVLSSDVESDDAYREAESLIERRVHSVLAVPLEVRGTVLGALYLEASSPGARFDSELLQLVTTLGNLTALAIENARYLEKLDGENRRLHEELKIQHSMVGESKAMREVYEFVSRVAGRDSTVLICGESGTGKELVARAVHTNSARKDKPFVAINCAAITETLLESELFGHERGAFTGAVSQKKGKLEVAEGGTVFLDEIGELAIPMQAKLLRVLQERELERVGGTRAIKLDVRLIAATNRDLKEASRNGGFRSDLYYRLNVVSLQMPALRERREDIPLLAAFFAAQHGEKVKRRVAGISPEARACLIRYDWPGNVRELENAIERAVVLGSTELILAEDLPEAILEETAAAGEPVNALAEGIRQAKKELIERAIEQANGNYTEAAKLLGVHANHLFRLIRTLNLKPKRAR
ncbi:MAG TPA: sigma 54-interacting transcriptional regulator [Candidatus Sulfotelmatobacter sp.]|nr:sigma 54-interacting transcriptional regulator [Candidatus Sulfotelmatobacter sp.]